MRFSDSIVQKKQGMRPIFLGVQIIKSELMKNSFLHPKTKGKFNSDYKI